MALPNPTDLSAILPALETLLITSGVVPSSASVYLSLDTEDVRAPIGDSYLVLLPGRQAVNESIVAGAGNNACFVVGSLQVLVFNRLNLDRYGRHDDALTDTTLGLVAKMTAVAKALQQSTPLDINGNALLCEPMRLQSEEYQTRRNDNTGWLTGIMTFEFSYHRVVK